MVPAKVKLAELLGKRKEAEVLMNYQKTKNSRDKKKMDTIGMWPPPPPPSHPQGLILAR